MNYAAAIKGKKSSSSSSSSSSCSAPSSLLLSIWLIILFYLLGAAGNHTNEIFLYQSLLLLQGGEGNHVILGFPRNITWKDIIMLRRHISYVGGAHCVALLLREYYQLFHISYVVPWCSFPASLQFVHISYAGNQKTCTSLLLTTRTSERSSDTHPI